MIMALAMNRVEMVKLLLDYGISIKEVLTNDVLEFLYAYRSRDVTSTLKFEIDSKKDKSKYMSVEDVEKKGDKNVELYRELLSLGPIHTNYCRLPRKVIVNLTKKLCQRFLRTSVLLEEVYLLMHNYYIT